VALYSNGASEKEATMNFGNIVKDLDKRLWFLTGNYTLPYGIGKEDLYQEAVVSLYERYLKGGLEGKNNTYLINSCRFAVNNYLRKTRPKIKFVSLDEIGEDNLDESIATKNEKPQNNEDFFIEEIVTAAELNLRETKILKLLFSGYTCRDAGKSLNISHVMILKIKKGIYKKIKRLPDLI
jgi:RNA polymerase sigma factor (sigma-70 family)